MLKRELLNHHFEKFTQDVAYDPKTNRFILADFVLLRLIESGEVVFSSKRIALDGIRSLRVEGRILRGLAVVAFEGEEKDFTFDLDSLEIDCPVDFSSWDISYPPQAPVKTKPWWKFW